MRVSNIVTVSILAVLIYKFNPTLVKYLEVLLSRYRQAVKANKQE